VKKGSGSCADTVALPVSVVPRSPRDEVAGSAGDAVRIRLTAPPVENRANEALVRFLAGRLGVPRADVRVAAGVKGRRKIVRVAGITLEEIFARLGLPPRG
jgi:uncharacterized protein (TIGR00251 family)